MVWERTSFDVGYTLAAIVSRLDARSLVCNINIVVMGQLTIAAPYGSETDYNVPARHRLV